MSPGHRAQWEVKLERLQMSNTNSNTISKAQGSVFCSVCKLKEQKKAQLEPCFKDYSRNVDDR